MQGPLRKSVGKALRKCVEGGPTPLRDKKKRTRALGEAGGEPQHQHQQYSPHEESSRQRKRGRARDGGGDDKSDYEVRVGGGAGGAYALVFECMPSLPYLMSPEARSGPGGGRSGAFLVFQFFSSWVRFRGSRYRMTFSRYGVQRKSRFLSEIPP